jgi:hypothetical protein
MLLPVLTWNVSNGYTNKQLDSHGNELGNKNEMELKVTR